MRRWGSVLNEYLTLLNGENLRFIHLPTTEILYNFLFSGMIWFGLWFMVFNATFNNISVIPWRSVLLVEETGVPGENHQPVASKSQTLSHNVVSSTCTPRLSRIRTHDVSDDRHH